MNNVQKQLKSSGSFFMSLFIGISIWGLIAWIFSSAFFDIIREEMKFDSIDKVFNYLSVYVLVNVLVSCLVIWIATKSSFKKYTVSRKSVNRVLALFAIFIIVPQLVILASGVNSYNNKMKEYFNSSQITTYLLLDGAEKGEVSIESIDKYVDKKKNEMMTELDSKVKIIWVMSIAGSIIYLLFERTLLLKYSQDDNEEYITL